MRRLTEPGEPYVPERRLRIGDILVEAGVVDRQQVEQAAAPARASKRLGEVLVDQGLATERQIAEALAAQLQLPLVDLRREPVSPECLALVPEILARAHRLVPVAREDRTLVVAMADPTDILAVDVVERATRLIVRPVVAPASEVVAAIRRSYGLLESREILLGPGQDAAADGAGPAVHVVDFLVAHAARHRATDIHCEPEDAAVRVRYRIDGFLWNVTTLTATVYQSVATRLKVLAHLDVTDRRLPQDGAFTATVDGHSLDVRVSVLPTLHGERVALRLLDRRQQVLALDRLGMQPAVRSIYERLIRRPHGVILVSGPTGSGKSTTLASTLLTLPSADRNIITIEDPVEYRLSGVSQVQVNLDAGLDFATGLRSILRHAPDVLMVGEIRDPETARIAVQAGLAGILVLATIHTNDAPAALLRLGQMGVPPYLIASGVAGVVSQRLVRLLCPHCKRPAAPLTETARWLEAVVGEETPLPGEDVPSPQPALAQGCDRCEFSGYLGRTGIFEVLPVTPTIQELTLARAPKREVEQAARAEGMRSMRLDGALKVLRGITTLEEVVRVTEEGDDVRLPCPLPETGRGRAHQP